MDSMHTIFLQGIEVENPNQVNNDFVPFQDSQRLPDASSPSNFSEHEENFFNNTSFNNETKKKNVILDLSKSFELSVNDMTIEVEVRKNERCESKDETKENPRMDIEDPEEQAVEKRKLAPAEQIPEERPLLPLEEEEKRPSPPLHLNLEEKRPSPPLNPLLLMAFQLWFSKIPPQPKSNPIPQSKINTWNTKIILMNFFKNSPEFKIIPDFVQACEREGGTKVGTFYFIKESIIDSPNFPLYVRKFCLALRNEIANYPESRYFKKVIESKHSASVIRSDLEKVNALTKIVEGLYMNRSLFQEEYKFGDNFEVPQAIDWDFYLGRVDAREDSLLQKLGECGRLIQREEQAEAAMENLKEFLMLKRPEPREQQ